MQIFHCSFAEMDLEVELNTLKGETNLYGVDKTLKNDFSLYLIEPCEAPSNTMGE